MNPDTIKNSIQAVIDGLTPLAQKMQVPVQGLWKFALMHNYAVASFELIMTLACIVVIGAGIWSFKKGMKCPKYEGDGYVVVGVFGMLLPSIAIIFLLYGAVMRFVAPEWETASDITCLINSCDGK